MLQITPLIRERIKLLRDVLTAADFFFVDQLPPYDPAELDPAKGRCGHGKEGAAEGSKPFSPTWSSNMTRWIKLCAPLPRNLD